MMRTLTVIVITSSDVEQMEMELRRLKKAKMSTELTTADEEIGLDEGALPTLESDDSDEYDDEMRNVVADEQELPVKEGDFVVVKLSGKKVQKHYIGQVSQVPSHDQKGTIKYLKREKQSSFQFVFSNDDEYDIEEEDIVQKLPAPFSNGGTARAARHLVFPVDLSIYSNMC